MAAKRGKNSSQFSALCQTRLQLFPIRRQVCVGDPPEPSERRWRAEVPNYPVIFLLHPETPVRPPRVRHDPSHAAQAKTTGDAAQPIRRSVTGSQNKGDAKVLAGETASRRDQNKISSARSGLLIHSDRPTNQPTSGPLCNIPSKCYKTP